MTRSKSNKASETTPPPQVRILVLHGPNLNLPVLDGPGSKGFSSLSEVHAAMEARGRANGVMVESFQSNHEGQLVDRIQAAASEGVSFIVINPSAYAHTSIALRDALCAVAIPFIEVHLANIFGQESFRHHSYFSDCAVGVVSGLGAYGYLAALEFALETLHKNN